MNILIVCPYFYPDKGGVENYVYNISKNLIKKGHSITVLCATKEGQDKTEILDGIKVIRQKQDFIISNTAIKLNLYFTLSKLLKKDKYDLINAHTPVPYYADIASYASKKNKVPFILTYHAGSLIKGKPVIDTISKVYQILEKRMLKNATKIITVTDFVKEKYLRNHKEKIVIISPGVDTHRFVPKDSTKKEGLLFVGQLNEGHKWKGLKYLLDAMALLPKDIKLTVVGDGNLLSFYKTYAESKKLNVEFKGKISDNDLIVQLQISKILILPSYSTAESFGMVLIEAMACGTPVIGSDIGGIPYVIKENETGLLVEPKNPKSIAKTIEKLYNDKQLWDKLKENGIKEVKEKYNWKIIVGKTEKAFKSVI